MVYWIRVNGVRYAWFWRNRHFRQYISSSDTASGHLAWTDSFSKHGRGSVIWCSVNRASVLQLRRRFHRGSSGLSPDPKSINRISTRHTSFLRRSHISSVHEVVHYHKALDLGGLSHSHRRYVHQQDGGLYPESCWENASQCAYISQFHHPAVYIAVICFVVLSSCYLASASRDLGGKSIFDI